MERSTLYDEDILLWSERQAEIIRKLGQTSRDLPNEFDIDNVAEEIESVGRSELASVGSYIQLVLVHILKLACEPDAQAARHWRREILVFGDNLQRRFAPSMERRLDLDHEWRIAVETVRLDLGDIATLETLPTKCPFVLADFLHGGLDGRALAMRLNATDRPT